MRGERNDLPLERRGPRTLAQVTDLDKDRFKSKVYFGADQECWGWRGSLHRNGYGQFSLGKKKHLAHRFSFFLFTGVDPGAFKVCHSCDNPACVNPHHLWLGTTKQNAEDCNRKGRRPAKETHWNAKLKTGDIIAIKRLREMGATQREIAALFGIQQMQVSRIVRGLRWK